MDDAVVVHLHVVDGERPPGDPQRPLVGELPAGLGVKERLLEHERRPPLPRGHGADSASKARANGSFQ